MESKHRLLVLGFLAAVLFGSFQYYGLQRSQISSANSLASIFKTNAGPLNLGARSQVSNCKINGPFPDPNCTPGNVFKTATPEIICVSGYTKTVRNVSTSLKKKVYSEYGLTYPQPKGNYEADHFIPLELGGSNDIANLFPEAADPNPGFHEKDLVENYLHNEVCAGHLELTTAQNQIAHDWLSVYNNLTPDQIRELKTEFVNN